MENDKFYGDGLCAIIGCTNTATVMWGGRPHCDGCAPGGDIAAARAEVAEMRDKVTAAKEIVDDQRKRITRLENRWDRLREEVGRLADRPEPERWDWYVAEEAVLSLMDLIAADDRWATPRRELTTDERVDLVNDGVGVMMRHDNTADAVEAIIDMVLSRT